MKATRPRNRVSILGRLLVLGFLLTSLSCGSIGGGSQGRGQADRQADHQAASSDRLLQQANTAYERGDLAVAKQAYTQILEADPGHIEARFKLGVVNYRQGQFENSRTHFLTVLSMAPNHHKATYNLGVIYAAEGALKNSEKATFFFDKYLSLVPNAPQRRQIMRWKALQASEKRREERSTAADGSGALEDPGTSGARSGDLKQWLQQEAGRLDP
jgi:tetratricopeptide (TPR) repeat protein